MLDEQPSPRTASVVINNYNYARFLGEAMDSALAQTHPATEVVVVDDGSTDDSREVIDRYGDSVVTAFTKNGGQSSAINTGFEASNGELVIFLDADDTLFPNAVERAVATLAPGMSKVHWPLVETDAQGKATGRLWPQPPLPRGDMRQVLFEQGPDVVPFPPTSGNAWARGFLATILPMPVLRHPMDGDGARRPMGSMFVDTYMAMMAALLGTLGLVPEPLGTYRIHGGNYFADSAFDERVDVHAWVSEQHRQELVRVCQRESIAFPEEMKTRLTWFERLAAARDELISVIPEGERFILLDEDQFVIRETRGRTAVPFPELDGAFGGTPVDGVAAVAELQRLRARGLHHMVVAFPAFWWLDHYTELAECLNSTWVTLLRSEQVIVYKAP